MIPFAAVLAALILAHSGPAYAQTDDPGRIHFQAGAADYESGDYEHALGEFQRAYELSERKQLFYNIALSYQQLGDLEHAIEFLGRYLSEVENIPNRSALERRQANLQRRLDAQHAQTAEQTAGEAAAAQAAAERAAAEQAAADRAAAEAASENSAETHEVQDGDAGDTDVAPPPPEVAPSAGGGANVPAIASFVGGGVGLAMAVTFGVMALSEDSDVSGRDCAETATCTGVGKMDTFALISDIGTGLAVVGVGLGLVFLLTSDDEEADPTRARVNVAPFAAPNAAGLAAQGTF